jgi:RNA polymerase sigma-70 factor (ECF subfamily)
MKQSRIRFSEDILKSIEDDIIKVLPEMDIRLNALKECIKKLGQTERTLLKLRYEKGYTLKNIGAYISKSTRVTYYSLVRIHKYLLECVKRGLAGEHS